MSKSGLYQQLKAMAIRLEEHRWHNSRGEHSQAAIILKLAARENTYSHRFNRHRDHLDLTSTPAWFLKIQQLYNRYWCERYQEVSHISVRRPLFLQQKKSSNTPIEPSVLEGRLRRATKRALGGKPSPGGFCIVAVAFFLPVTRTLLF